ncbi:GNAT family N-acetyltransferase [Salmonella enterica]|uniref:GNAT family N-acetyltransferase n=5 Tax=Salmonella enterica TaxID=28901 RepID=A0A3Z4PIX7_SALET|nr:GNAT family N-acetyltransferase [Salmonella enterica]EAW1403484.1 GNAT family N-acetyltransferase [Salmonella enterica subsp. enterica]EBF8619608.1 GNAT family N-acetyltransferase [Salmonella enterica subsp. enterica serovar Istanbul]EBZ8634311.1 GNAT family N-acetyltransferase [Salmonella enterica subsp. enterica serovar Strathcona]ECG1954468.1 GNAT family N-acetyltransferase [Salmonella enterica subsp. enterica serovar Typhimurium]ECG2548140.1 GNAT family N-acetyltransferase [Salmonella e
MEILAKSPKNCSADELKLFEELVFMGDEVDPNGLKDRILNAEQLFFIKEDKYVGIAALKRPKKSYKSDVFYKAGSSDEDKYEYEIGWIYIIEEERENGYGGMLMDSISNYLSNNSSSKACFGTVRENNTGMQRLFAKHGFSKVGHSYNSTRGEYSLVLYVPYV